MTTISAAVSALDAARITKAMVSASRMTNRNANLTLVVSLGVPEGAKCPSEKKLNLLNHL
jgi:hypothetical protein